MEKNQIVYSMPLLLFFEFSVRDCAKFSIFKIFYKKWKNSESMTIPSSFKETLTFRDDWALITLLWTRDILFFLIGMTMTETEKNWMILNLQVAFILMIWPESVIRTITWRDFWNTRISISRNRWRLCGPPASGGEKSGPMVIIHGSHFRHPQLSSVIIEVYNTHAFVEICEDNVKREYLEDGVVFAYGKDKDGKSMFIIKSKLHVRGVRDFGELQRCIIYWFERMER